MTAIKPEDLARVQFRVFPSAAALCAEMENLRKQGVVQFFVEHSEDNVWILKYVSP